MNKIPVDAKRDIALIGHHGSGKTQLVDAMLFNAKLIDRTGILATDTEEVEKEKKASFSMGVTSFAHGDNRIYVLDTPGMADFMAETVNGIYACENVVAVINSTAGMEIQTERFGAIAGEQGKGIIAFFNMLDKERSSYQDALADLADSFERTPVLVQLQIGSEGNFKGLVDLIAMKAYIYEGNSGTFSESAIPADLAQAAEEARTKMIEDIVQNDEELMMKYLEGEELSGDEIVGALKKAYLANEVVPVLLGSALKNIGVHQLIDFVVSVGKKTSESSPRSATLLSDDKIEVNPTEEEPLVAYIFKSVVDPFVGKLTYMKLLSGSLKQGDTFVVVDQDSQEKAGHVILPEGLKEIEVDEATVGDVVKLSKLKKSAVGNTATHKDRQMKLDLPVLPEPMISKSIQPKSKGDIDKISGGLARLAESDPTFKWENDPETNETVISGLGSVHLDIMIERLKKLFSVDVEVGKPKIAYRETVRKTVETEYKHKKQTGGHGQYGHVQIRIEPNERGGGFEFIDKIVGGVVPKNYIPAVEKGVVEAMKKGIVAFYPVVDTKVTLFYGSYHDVDSSDMSFQIAARQAFKNGMTDANPVILEPIMDIEVFVPDEATGDIMGEITSRRGRPMGMEPQGKGTSKVVAQAPLAEMLDFANKLSSITSGRGYFTMKFNGYQETPPDVQQKIVVERQRELEEQK
ncbi:MAG TPA: elongation factor G [Mesotoga sp.]|nr:elongation factor G [Mesotoga sp.]